MADPTEGNQSPSGKEGKDVSGGSPSNEGGLQFEDLAGSQASFEVPEMPPPPKAIQSLKDKRLRQRAEDAWKSVFLLQEVIKLWWEFLKYGHQGWRLCPEVEERIIQLFPSLKDLGAVIEAFAVDAKLSTHAKAKQRKVDKIYKIRRSPTRHLDQAAKKRYRGTGLNELIQAFRNTITTHAQCLNAAGIKSPIFEQPSDAIAAELAKITRVDLNLGGEVPPLDFRKKLRDWDGHTAAGKVRRELDRLRNLLDESPALVLSDAPKFSPADATGSRPAHHAAKPAHKVESRWYHDQNEKPPPQFEFGPLAGYKKEFAEVCFEQRTDHRTLEKACIGDNACFWVRELTRRESKYSFGIWFQTENDLQGATKRLASFRERNTDVGADGSKPADDSPASTSG
jgi:hypothetical protein